MYNRIDTMYNEYIHVTCVIKNLINKRDPPVGHVAHEQLSFYCVPRDPPVVTQREEKNKVVSRLV